LSLIGSATSLTQVVDTGGAKGETPAAGSRSGRQLDRYQVVLGGTDAMGMQKRKMFHPDGAVLREGSPSLETVLVSTDEVLEQMPWLARFRPTVDGGRRRASRALKRIVDLTLVALSLPLLAPVYLLCALALKLESFRGPVLFVQQRTGENGRRFRMFKFRTMVTNAEELKERIAHLNQLQWPDFKVNDDPRVTRVGRFLRRSSLDELPQILNVIRGDMSLVGPRPTSFAVETYQEWHKARLRAVPGLTGLWQIVGRGEMEFDERVHYDLAYIERQSLWLDLQILLRTVGAVFTGRGTH
jgi:lipopolysaccharide/colanic/teichoic acid biosynthesis glycosyltransferase